MGRDISVCHPRLQVKAIQLVGECEKQGLKIKVTDCFRSREEQDALYAKGRTVPPIGKKYTVTNAPGSSYSSHHMWGTAFDFCRNDGRDAYDDRDGFFSKVGAIGKNLGLEWGGDWSSLVDKPHFQLPDWGSNTSRLRMIYGTPDVFMRSAVWERGNVTEIVNGGEDFNMPLIRKGSRGKAVQIWQVIIGVTADGIFGSNTEAATWLFQQNAGLAVDGIVGKNSWKAGLESVV